MKNKKIRKTTALLALCLIIFTGCSHNNSNSSNNIYNGSSNLADSNNVEKFVNPFDQYDLQQSQIEIISNAEDILANKCMKKLGFANGNKFPKYGIGNNGSYIAKFTEFDKDFGPLTITYAQKWGYLAPGTTGDIVNGKMSFFDGKEWKYAGLANVGSLKGKDGEQYDALYNDGGCNDQASKQVLGKLKPDQSRNSQIDKLKQDADTITNDNNKIIELNSSWSKCMKEQGFNYSSFSKPMEKYSPGHLNKVSKTERKIAVIDVKCKNKINFINTYRQILQTNQQDIINKNAVLFKESQDYYKTWVDQAQKIIQENE